MLRMSNTVSCAALVACAGTSRRALMSHPRAFLLWLADSSHIFSFLVRSELVLELDDLERDLGLPLTPVPELPEYEQLKEAAKAAAKI